jgi:integrase
MVGTREEYPTESAARKAPVVQAILLRLNAEQPAAPGAANFGAVIARYEQEEMPERYSTRAAYQSYINNQIRPRWADTAMSAVKPMAVEDWLRNLALAPKTKSHVRSLMHTIFQCAERWELIEKNPIKLVRVKGGTKRLKTPRVLAPEEFYSLLPLIREPYRTMVLIAGCLGLRVSEIVALQWRDFDFAGRTLLIQRSVVHGRVGDVKTEYSRDSVPLDTAVVEALMLHKERAFPTLEGWLFANPVTKKPYHQEEIQKKHIRKAGVATGIGGDIGWHTFRHSYRSWLDETGAPLTVQKELMRHASIQTTMNIYGKAMTDSKRQAHSKVVEMVLNSSKNDQTDDHKKPIAAIGS